MRYQIIYTWTDHQFSPRLDRASSSVGKKLQPSVKPQMNPAVQSLYDQSDGCVCILNSIHQHCVSSACRQCGSAGFRQKEWDCGYKRAKYISSVGWLGSALKKGWGAVEQMLHSVKKEPAEVVRASDSETRNSVRKNEDLSLVSSLLLMWRLVCKYLNCG